MSLLVAGLVAGGVSALAQGIGSVAASHAAQKAYDAQKAANDKKEADLANWRDRIMNEDPTQRASAQRTITKLSDMLRQRNQAVAGQQTVTGGTGAAAAAEKEASNQAVADAMSQVAASGDERKDRADQMAMQGQMNIDDARAQMEAARYNQQGQAIQTAAGGVANAANSFMTAYAMQNGKTASQKAAENANT